jgi:hypothetical protein
LYSSLLGIEDSPVQIKKMMSPNCFHIKPHLFLPIGVCAGMGRGVVFISGICKAEHSTTAPPKSLIWGDVVAEQM